VKTGNDKILLFSIDFEDIRLLIPDGMKYPQRVPEMTEEYLLFLRERNARSTFFVVGNTVKLYPSLLKDIISEGHEIGCHTHTHIPLNEHTAASFRDDMLKNMEALYNIGAENIYGFRAPGLSITEKTQWAFDVLIELGFKYSSSVMATRSAFHGWPEFGEEFKKIKNALWELPPTLLPYKNFSIPFASSVYFRFLPLFLSKRAFREKFRQQLPVISYFHPFDIDHRQERFMHPGVNNSPLYNFLMYYNRKGMLEKFGKAIPVECKIIPHIEYVENYLERAVSLPPAREVPFEASN
jgi:polysaccharide deacetylase family protein (PEP-CTERM system associated)